MTDLRKLLDEIQERSRTAGDHVAKLCTKEDRWKMSVPVQDTDSDVLLTQITDHDVPRLADAIECVLAITERADRKGIYHPLLDNIQEAITEALGSSNGY